MKKNNYIFALVFLIFSTVSSANTNETSVAVNGATEEKTITNTKATIKNNEVDSYYTKAELQKIFKEKYANKIPAKFYLGTIDSVEFPEDGVLLINGTIDDSFFKMPMLARMQLESMGQKQLEKSYCKKVKAKKDPYHRVKEVQGVLRDSKGSVVRTLTLSPEDCEE